MLNCTLSCPHYMSLSQVFNNHIWGLIKKKKRVFQYIDIVIIFSIISVSTLTPKIDELGRALSLLCSICLQYYFTNLITALFAAISLHTNLHFCLDKPTVAIVILP